MNNAANPTQTETVEIIKGQNRRWTLCRAAFGRKPEGWEFINWIQGKWREWDVDHGTRDHSIEEHAAFDAWLEVAR